MYVVDESDGKVYTYNMPDAIDARLATLSLSGVDIGEFDGGRTEYEGVPGEGVTETTVEATTVQRRTDIAIHPPDADGDDANGHQVSLDGVEEITVTVTSPDGSRTKTYRVTVRRPEVEVALAPTWTSIEWPGADGVTIVGPLQDGDIGDKVVVVYHWDEATAAWLAFFPGLEGVPGLNTLTTFTGAGPHLLDRRRRTTHLDGRHSLACRPRRKSGSTEWPPDHTLGVTLRERVSRALPVPRLDARQRQEVQEVQRRSELQKGQEVEGVGTGALTPAPER